MRHKETQTKHRNKSKVGNTRCTQGKAKMKPHLLVHLLKVLPCRRGVEQVLRSHHPRLSDSDRSLSDLVSRPALFCTALFCTTVSSAVAVAIGEQDCGEIGPGAWRKWLACEIIAQGLREGKHESIAILPGGRLRRGRWRKA